MGSLTANVQMNRMKIHEQQRKKQKAPQISPTCEAYE
jgi:hypothetical protein